MSIWGLEDGLAMGVAAGAGGGGLLILEGVGLGGKGMLLLLLDWDLDFFDLAIVLGVEMLWEQDEDKGAWR